MVDPKFEQAVDTTLDDLCLRFPLGYRPVIQWRGYRVSAGMAYYRRGIIGLSHRVLKDENAVIDTLIHEYAHLLAVKRFGQKGAGHGEPWQQAMIDLGQEPKVRHNYAVERNESRQQVTYVCLRCGKSIVRARKLPKRRRYLHANCGGDIRLSRIEPVTASKEVS